MRDNFQKLLMTPHIILMRGDIKISDKDLLVIALGKTLCKITSHIFEKVELVFELIIDDGVSDIAARRNIEVMKFEILVAQVATNLTKSITTTVKYTKKITIQLFAPEFKK